MALSKSSKILVSDINTALSNKQDKLSYTPIKSVNGTSADSSGNVTISTDGGTSTAVSNCKAGTTSTTYNLPSGGTWAYIMTSNGSNNSYANYGKAGTASGGTSIGLTTGGGSAEPSAYFAIRIS